MDLFVLDSQLRRTAVFDLYESLIWTERFASVGEFELIIPSTLQSRNLLTQGTYLAINESTRIMVIRTVTDRVSEDGRTFLEIKGPSLEDILIDRVVRPPVPNEDIRDLNWYFTDKTPPNVAREIFQKICVDGVINSGDVIPYYTPGSIYPPDTIPEPSEIIPLSISPTTVYTAIKELCDIYDLGFRLVRNGDTGQLMFNVYSGNDRTTLQTTLTPVIFAPELDNLTDVAYLTSSSMYKNVAHVISPDGEVLVYADNVDPSVAGFERRVLFVDAGNIRYPDRSQLDPLPYTVTEEEAATVRFAQNLVNTSQFQSDSLQKLVQMSRLYNQDSVNINAVIGTTYSLTGNELLAITNALGQSSVTQDQKNALTKMQGSIRLEYADISALNSMLANNTNISTQNKDRIATAANKQSEFVMPGEKTIITALINKTNAYNATEDLLLQERLIQKGKDELAINTNLAAFDGEIPNHSQYKYNEDYFLGDLVEIRNADQVTNQMRVTEQIFASDANGDRAYPTLSQKLLITPGSWYAEPTTVVWDDLTNPADTWESRP